MCAVILRVSLEARLASWVRTFGWEGGGGGVSVVGGNIDKKIKNERKKALSAILDNLRKSIEALIPPVHHHNALRASIDVFIRACRPQRASAKRKSTWLDCSNTVTATRTE